MTPIRIEAAVLLVAGSVLASYWLFDGASGHHPKPQRHHKLLVIALWIAALVGCVVLWQQRG